MSVKGLRLLLVVVAGAAAAIPGLAVTRQFNLPGGTGPLFEYVLVTVSAALVLAAYVSRNEIKAVSGRTTAIVASLGIVAILAFFVLHVALTTLVLVEHSYEGETGTQVETRAEGEAEGDGGSEADRIEGDGIERQFFPLFVGEAGRESIRRAGSRRALITNPPVSGQDFAGIEGVQRMTTEWNTAFTLVVLLLSYAGLIGTSALVFSFLGFHALGTSPPPEETKPAGVPDPLNQA